MRLDQVDRQLIASLKLDGRMSYAELAGRLGVSEGTARNRLARLTESGTVRILPIVDQTKVGYRLNVWIGIRCVPGALRQVADDLAALHAVRYVGACTGFYDVIGEAIFLSQAEMLDFLESELPQVGGIVALETSTVLEISKLGYEWELREEDALTRQPRSRARSKGGGQGSQGQEET
jgi:Lrp/AsnC family transcriptional regulator for asnA, asnC and gidA